MKYISYAICILLLSFSIGCQSSFRQSGGGATTKFNDITQVVNPDTKEVTTTDKSVFVNTTQPDNPDSPGQITLSKDKEGKVTVKVTTGQGQNITNAVAKFDLLEIVTWTGTGISVLGVIAIIFGKKILLPFTFGAGLIGLGLSMIILSVLLAEYSFYILCFSGICALGLIAYLILRYIDTAKTADQVVTINEVAMKAGIIDKDKYHEMARVANNASTNKIIKQIKGM